MIFRQLIHDDLGCAGYLIGDAGAGVAAVPDGLDPERPVAVVCRSGQRHGCPIVAAPA